MAKARPRTTLFMLMSVDGKISTGNIDERDVDRDFPKIKGVSEGLYQYYDLEQRTDLFSLNTGRVQEKMGVNEKTKASKTPVSFILIDNKPHLTQGGVKYFLEKNTRLFLVTTNKNHPAFQMKNADNLEILYYEHQIDFRDLFEKLKEKYSVDAVTLQSGGTLNAVFLRAGLIDHVSIVVAPCLIGGKETATLIDGSSLMSEGDVSLIRALLLRKCDVLEHSYLHLQYDVVNV